MTKKMAEEEKKKLAMTIKTIPQECLAMLSKEAATVMGLINHLNPKLR
uniref:Uncharacterized protein LOC103333898 n=1 Tax=Rhizophora mucronata TaxID=61149 RepID=A0A2P2MKC5_RHIMU